MTLEELKTKAADVARELANAGEPVPPDLRNRFLLVRTELIRRGVFDPMLIRFDTATVPKASVEQVAERLKVIAGNLSI